MDKEKLKIILIILGVFSLGIFLVFFLGIVPLWKAIKAEELAFKKVEFRISNLQEKRKKISEYRKRKQDLESNGELIKKAVLKKGEEVSFVEELEANAQKAGVKMAIKSYLPPAKKSVEADKNEKVKEETVQEMQKRQAEEKKTEYFQLLVEGNYPQVLMFIYRLENMGRSFVITSTKLNNLFETKGEIEGALRQKLIPDKFAIKGEIIISFNWN